MKVLSTPKHKVA